MARNIAHPPPATRDEAPQAAWRHVVHGRVAAAKAWGHRTHMRAQRALAFLVALEEAPVEHKQHVGRLGKRSLVRRVFDHLRAEHGMKHRHHRRRARVEVRCEDRHPLHSIDAVAVINPKVKSSVGSNFNTPWAVLLALPAVGVCCSDAVTLRAEEPAAMCANRGVVHSMWLSTWHMRAIWKAGRRVKGSVGTVGAKMRAHSSMGHSACSCSSGPPPPVSSGS
jgi:hypothetical protein